VATFDNSVAEPGTPSAPLIPSSTDPNSLSNPTLTWLMEKHKEGKAFLKSQAGWNKIGDAIDAIMSAENNPLASFASSVSRDLSHTKTNRIAKIAEDIAALLTDIRPFWEYSVANRRFEQHAQIYSKLSTFWYQNRNIDLVLSACVKYYTVAGSAYIHIYWDPEIEDIDACALDPRNVIPISPKKFDSLEDCQGVIIDNEVPISYIRERYGINVKAESDGMDGWLGRLKDAEEDTISPIWRSIQSNKPKSDLPRIPTAVIHTCYLKDSRTNDTDHDIEMGTFHDSIDESGRPVRIPSTTWSYVVKPGEKRYPHLRMIVWVGTNILYDGPGFYWHGNFPVIKLTLNPYPWSFLGKAPIWDLLSLQDSLNRLLRVVDDHADQVAQPGAIGDKNNVSEATFKTLNTRRAGWKIRQNPLAGQGIKIVNPPPLDASIPAQIQWIIDEMAEISGLKDIARMMDLKQLPSNDTVDSIINQMTPGLRMRSRIFEAFARNIARQLAYNFSQFYTLPLRVAILGPGGITADDFDYDPGSLIPDFPDSKDYKTEMGDDGQVHTIINPDAFVLGPAPKYKRAQEFLRKFIFKISPASLLNGAQMERTLLYFQLTRAGVMDPITLLEQLNVPNIGVEQIPDNVRTILDRIKWCQDNGLMMQVNPAGAKASGQAPPRVVTKES
jgi:hypothetical protein